MRWWNRTILETTAMYESDARAHNGADRETDTPDEGIRVALYAAPKPSGDDTTHR